MGYGWIWVQMSIKIPMGYPCPTLLGSMILAWLACLHRCCSFILFLLELLMTPFDFERTQLDELAVPIVDSIQQASDLEAR